MRRFFFLCLVLGLAGCGGSPEKYYRLNATEAATTGATTGSSSGLSVFLGPVSLPTYIDRPEVVFATGPNEFQIPADSLWIGSLQDNISRAVATDLGRILGSRNVRGSLDPGFKPAYRIALDIRQFHGISGQEAILDLSWRISDAGGQNISRHSGRYRESIVGDGYASLVAAQSRLLNQAARAIAVSLRGR